jgi:hypothetical protein
MEAVAYTWFNRFAALRYMELHDYLGHGHRALSSTSGGLPDILTHATDLAECQSAATARPERCKNAELKLAGNRDGELYRLLLVAQCNALSRTMPFLFERIDDDTELLLPDNLLRTDSIIAKLVAGVPEKTGKRSKSSAGCTSSTSARKRTRSLARWSKAKTSPPPPSSSPPTGSCSTWCKTAWAACGSWPTRQHTGQSGRTTSARRANARGAGPARCPHPDPRALKTATP